LKRGLNKDPRIITGTMKMIAKNQYPIATRQISNRLTINLRPAFPSSTAVMKIPAIEAERTETNTRLEGSMPWTTRIIVLAPRAQAKMKKANTGNLFIKLE
jgi:hypothetical protein